MPIISRGDKQIALSLCNKILCIWEKIIRLQLYTTIRMNSGTYAEWNNKSKVANTCGKTIKKSEGEMKQNLASCSPWTGGKIGKMKTPGRQQRQK